jgi:integrase
VSGATVEDLKVREFDREVLSYQSTRLKESAAPKSINEEVRFLLTMMGELGDVIRVRLRKRKKLKIPSRRKIGKANEPEETQQMRQLSRNSRSPHIHLALTMALNAGMRDAEIKSLAWSQIHSDKNFIQGERAKRLRERGGRFQSTRCSSRPSSSTWHGMGRNSMRFVRSGLYFLLVAHAPGDPTRHVTTIKTARRNIRTNANVTGRWHDHRHTLITQLAESGAGEETIRQIVGYVSKEVLRDYLHVRMKAKRDAPEGIAKPPSPTD